MASVAERTMGATEFKAKCLRVMDEIASGAVARVIITRHGHPIMQVGPVQPPDRQSAFGMSADYNEADVQSMSEPLFTDEAVDRYLDYRVRKLETMLNEKLPDEC